MVEEGGEGSVRESVKDEGEVLETPNRRKNIQIGGPIGKIEDSPVFNFLNSLSPIKPAKVVHISQTINPLNLASLPSIFTSTHVNSPKDYRVLRRRQLSDPSKPEFASDHENKVEENMVNDDDTKQVDAQEENSKVRENDGDWVGEASFDGLQFVVDYSEDLSYNSTSPKSSSVLEAVGNADIACSSTKLISCVINSPQSAPYGSDMVTKGKDLIVQNTEVLNCEWDSLISDAFIFESPNVIDSYKKTMDPESSFYTNLENEINNIHSLCSAVSNEQLDEDNEHDQLSTEPGQGNEVSEAYVDPGEAMDYEHMFGSYRGMRRRCLVFEMSGGRKKQLEESLRPESNDLHKDQSLLLMKRKNNSASRVLPGIGLHLNSLAATSKDTRIISHDSSSSGRLLIGPGSSVNFHSSTGNEVHSVVLDVETENAIIPVDEGCQASEYMETEDTNQSSPKKKRHRVEASGDGDGCKRCNCKKSKCLKLYCECFAAGVYCVDLCACIDCFNKPVHEDTVLATRKQIESRNPLAFAPKVIRGSDTLSEAGDDSSKTPASARHKRGCNCKKSGCLKKYCECYQGGVGCSINCRCEGCKNAFGRKDGMEAEIEEDEWTDATEKTICSDLNSASAIPATPLQGTTRQTMLQHHHLSSKNKPPRVTPSSSMLGKRSFRPSVELDEHLETVKENEMPKILQESTSVKSISPNGKRVSPPHKSSRKLILRSIPSFPSLTQNQ